MKDRTYLLPAITLILAITYGSIMFYGLSFALPREPQQAVEIAAFNSYSIDVKLEVKCDFDYKINKFKYHKNFLIKGKKSVIIRVPSNLKKCQVWSKIIWW